MSSLQGDFNNAKSTFSSWDSCMSKAYCKWPVIAGIIVGSLIVLSILFCVFGTLCCGLQCCLGCCSCCRACCPSPRDRRGGRYEQQPAPPPNYSYPGPNPYQPQAPMMYGPPGVAAVATPQFATFETPSKKGAESVVSRGVHEDSLPAMPSWDQAQSHHVEDHDPEESNTHSPDLEKGGIGGGGEAIPMGAIATAASPLNGRNAAGAGAGAFRSQSHHDEQLEPMLGQQSHGYNNSNFHGDGAYDHTDVGNPYATRQGQSAANSRAVFAGGDLGYGQQQPRTYNDDSDYRHYNDEHKDAHAGYTRSPPPPRRAPNFSSPSPSAPPSYHTRLPSVSDHIATAADNNESPSVLPLQSSSSPPPPSQTALYQASRRPGPGLPGGRGRGGGGRGGGGGVMRPPQQSPNSYSANNYTYTDNNSTVYEPSSNYRQDYRGGGGYGRNDGYSGYGGDEGRYNNNNNSPTSRSPPPLVAGSGREQASQPRPQRSRRQQQQSTELFYNASANGGDSFSTSSPPAMVGGRQWGERDSTGTSRKPVRGTWREV